MTLQETLAQLNASFTAAENTANSFSESAFFQRPATGKWSAAENMQHLFFSVKPLVGLFGKPELMLQFGKRNRPSMSYDDIVALYLEKLKTFSTANIVNVVDGLSPTKAGQIEVFHSINGKFIERASALSEEVLDDYQIPHPLLGLLTVREFIFFTDYHTRYHTQTMANILAGGL